MAGLPCQWVMGYVSFALNWVINQRGKGNLAWGKLGFMCLGEIGEVTLAGKLKR